MNTHGKQVDAQGASSDSPDWSLVPFNVNCARCGHDLHGLTDPVCPACELEFDWSVAVPIEHLSCAHCDYRLYGLTETRCPECGTNFSWDKALKHHRQKGKQLFECRWRQQPVRSFVRTWIMTLRPKRLWQTLDINSSPNVWPLIATILVVVLLFAATLMLCIGVEDWTWTHGYALVQHWPRGDWQLSAILKLPGLVLRAYRHPEFKMVLESVTLFILLWPISLVIFHGTMRAFHVRLSHILRTTTYALSPLLPLAVFPVFAPFWFGGISGQQPQLNIELPVVGAILVHMAWSIRCANRFYLRIPHPGAVAISSFSIALLGSMAACAVLHRQSYFGGLLEQLTGWLGF